MGAGLLLIAPGEAMHLVGHGRAHQLMVRRVKIHLIDPSTIAVKATQLRAVPVSQLPRFHQFVPGQLAHGIQRFGRPTSAMARNCQLQRQITAPQVIGRHGLRLIMNFVGLELRFD